MAKQPPIEDLNRDELLKLIRELMVRIDRLREENERLKRTQRRQAAPFSKETPVANPKKPGRKPGQGVFHRRPAPEQAPDVTVDVPAPTSCPFCSGPLESVCEEQATTTELPAQPKPVTPSTA